MVLAVLLACTHCASAAPGPAPRRPAASRPSVTSADELIALANTQGLPFENPLALSAEVHEDALRFVGTFGDPPWRLRRLMSYVNEVLGFQYTPNLTLTAQRTHLTRRGDCMAFANLFISLARGMGLPTFYVHVSEVLSHYEHKGVLFTSSHVAVGYGSGPQSVVVDITQERTDWRLALYKAIDDMSAVALFYNNIAVDAMTSGRLGDAERILLFLYKQAPHIEEIHNNLAVLMNRRGRYKDALNILLNAIQWFPSYKPFYTNGLVAAQRAGRPDLIAAFEEGGQSIEQQDPYFLVARGRNDYENKKYDQAAGHFEKALASKPDSSTIAAWLARALMAAGRTEEGEKIFAQALRLGDPESLIMRELAREFPSLEGIRAQASKTAPAARP